MIIISENGDQFYLYVNDHKINDSAQSIVKAVKVLNDTSTVKIVFIDKKLSDFNAKIYLLQYGSSCRNLEFTYAIEMVKGKNTLRFISTNVILADTLNKQKQASARVRDFLIYSQKEKDDKNRLIENYPAPEKCLFIIGDSLLERELKILQNNHIELNRVKDAKWFISNNCLNVSQTEKIVAVFDYEGSKEKLAEFGYDYLIDKENLLNLLPILKYKTEKEELKKFYSKKHQNEK
ncbi:MAG: DUF4476 domain-containing protein [Bacteroidia bacterium]